MKFAGRDVESKVFPSISIYGKAIEHGETYVTMVAEK